MEQYKKLSATEYKFMKVIWEHPSGVISNEIYRLFPQTMGAKSTYLPICSDRAYPFAIIR